MAAISLPVLIIALLHPIFAAEHPLLLLMSFDGLRYDFISPTKTPNIWSLCQNGVYAVNGIKTQVATVTAPNHHCIATGLYQESHGIIDNVFFDPIFKEHYDIWGFGGRGAVYQNSKLSKWYTGEAIWQTNMKSKRRLSGTYYWPAGDAEINDIKVKHKYKTWLDYNNDYNSWVAEIDELLSWFIDKNEPINFALYYNAEPDFREHSSDIFGAQVEQMVKQVDQIVGYLIEKCKQYGIFHELNLIITSDHGFTNVVDDGGRRSLSDYVRHDAYFENSYSLFPADGKESTAEEIYKNLSKAVADGMKIKVWRKRDFPCKYHWKNNHRIGSVLYFNEMGYQFGSGRSGYGTHFGYLNDDKEMNVLFVGHGPAFKIGYKTMRNDIENVDLYPLMCQILNISQAPNNGSLQRIFDVLKNDTTHLFSESDATFVDTCTLEHSVTNDENSRVLVLLIGFATIIVILYVFSLCCRRWHWHRKRRQSNFLQHFIRSLDLLKNRQTIGRSNQYSADKPFLSVEELNKDEEL